MPESRRVQEEGGIRRDVLSLARLLVLARVAIDLVDMDVVGELRSELGPGCGNITISSTLGKECRGRTWRESLAVSAPERQITASVLRNLRLIREHEPWCVELDERWSQLRGRNLLRPLEHVHPAIWLRPRPFVPLFLDSIRDLFDESRRRSHRRRIELEGGSSRS